MDARRMRLTELLTRQNGIVTRAQLRAAGYSERQIDHMLHTEQLFLVSPGVYSAVPVPPHAAQLTAAVCALGPGSAITAETAGAEIRIWKRRVRTIHATSRRARRSPAGVHLTRTRYLPESELVERDGVVMVAPDRLICDMAERQTAHALANVMHEAEFHGLLDTDRIERTARRLRNRPYTVRVFRALELNAEGAAGTMSVSEDRFQELREIAGLPEPWVNRWVEGADERHRLDTFWPERRLNCEVDGGPHSRRRSVRSDAEQDADVAAVGIRTRRFPTDQIWKAPGWVIAELQRLWSITYA